MTQTGHQLAAAQLAALQRSTHGALQVLTDLGDDEAFLISLNTRGIPRGPGIAVRARERFRVTIPAAFPFQPPSARVTHRRWQGSPHVQWGHQLCLYAAPSVEWNPAEGMRGFLERLLTWIERAAAGDLDPDGQPLHPPVAYRYAEAGQIVVYPDLGERVPWTDPTPHTDVSTATSTSADAETGARAVANAAAVVALYAWCVRDAARVEVREWLTLPQVVERLVSDDAVLGVDARVDALGRRYFVVPALLLSTELGWEYPLTAQALAAGLATSGFSGDQLLLALARTVAINQVLALADADADADADASGQSPDPVILMVGTPSRRLAGTTRLAHLVAWQLDDLGIEVTRLLRERDVLSLESLDSAIGDLGRRWLAVADVEWMQVHELRPEVTHRRDQHTSAAWLHNKHILVLGCGALGAPIAEQCVRAGAQRVCVLDNGAVTPGILVRQPYTYTDIGCRKATVLAARLNTLTSVPTVTARVANAVTTLLDPSFDPTGFDLIIDATADSGTRATLEHVRSPRRSQWPPVATVVIGHQADRGLVCLSRPGATGGGHDVLRRVALRAHEVGTTTWGDIAEDLFPDPPRAALFFPEPGCSAPTFVGSAAQVTALAAQLLLRALDLLADDTNTGDPMVAVAVRAGATTAGVAVADVAGSSTLSWSNDLICTDQGNGFEVRISAAAVAEMRAESRRVDRLHGPQVETGGMLLGAFDDALGVVHVDVVTGPPPDSRLSAAHFEHGVVGTQDAVSHHSRRSGRRTSYVGLWHTHPYGSPRPSSTDTASLSTLTTGPGAGSWALMLILAGPEQVWQQWREHTGTPQIYAHTVCRDIAETTRTDSTRAEHQHQTAPGPYFPGGYARPGRAIPPLGPSAASGRQSWWRRRRAPR